MGTDNPRASEVLAAPGELFSASADHLRSTVSTKWSKYGPDVIGAWVADMDFAVAPPIQQAMQRWVKDGFYGYGLASIREQMIDAFCTWWSRFGLSALPRRCVLVSELVQAMHACVAAFSESGDGVLLLTPIYPPFFGAITEQGRQVVEHRLTITDGRYRFDPDALRAQVAAAKPKVMLLCHPHNPVGRVWNPDELQVFADLAAAHDIVVVSDEIHADLVFHPLVFRSFATLGTETAGRTVTITSASKSFNVAGLRCALMHFGSDALLTRFRENVKGDLLGTPSVPGMLATTVAWQHGQEWLDACLGQLTTNRNMVTAKLLHSDIGVTGTVNEATYLQWLDFTALPGVRSALAATEESCVSDLLRTHAGLACNDGPNFGQDLSHFARLNFATSTDLLEDICTRITEFAAAMA